MLQQQKAGVRLDPNVLSIQGKPVIVLCGSLFYFRIPRALWQDRLGKIKAAGYNCIDVYFPWNYHEVAEGVWDFSGERDVEAFLQMAVDTGLWIVARPGPYICSEWDGGALPAYLFTHREMRIRDNDPLYLQYVSGWFDRILPIFRKFQVNDHGGIIALQLENELDFFDCDDRAGYMSALRDMALKHNIMVPLIGCAGQGDIAGATGNVPGIIPTCNFYPEKLDPGIEAKISHYRQELVQRQLPFMITETHRNHFHLRRLLSCGAKLLGPYNQVAGTDFGFTNAVNNWGNPLAFLTSDYNFLSMISPTGVITAEFFEARLLARLLEALGGTLAQAKPLSNSGITIQTDLSLPEGGPYGLALHGGGKLLAIPNLARETGTVVIRDGDRVYPQASTFTLCPDRCPLLLSDFPLNPWGINATLNYTTGELGFIAVLADRVVLVFYTDQTAELAFAVPAGVIVDTSGMTVQTTEDHIICCFEAGGVTTIQMRFPDTKRLQVMGIDRDHAARLEGFSPEGMPIWSQKYALSKAQMPETPSVQPKVQWLSCKIPGAAGALSPSKTPCGIRARHLEEFGILRGYGWYGARVNSIGQKQIEGFLLHNAADVLSLYINSVYHGTVTPGGGTAYVPALKPLESQEFAIEIRAEIWGHSNFDDPRLPAIRLHSLRGLSGITAVTAQRDVSKNWRFAPVFSAAQKQELLQPTRDTSEWIIVDWANWLTARQPQKGIFRKTLMLSVDADSWTLQFPGLQSLAEVFVNGKGMGPINPHTPYLDISAEVQPGQSVEVGIYLKKFYLAPGGKLILFEGITAKDWWVGGSGEADLAAMALNARSRAVLMDLPFRMPAGDVSWLWGDLPALEDCWTVRFTGWNVKISAFFNGKLVGRVWLPTNDVRPKMAGGADNLVYLPGPWFKNYDNSLALLVESVKLGEEAEITIIELHPERAGGS
jgi:beta-galactosidase